MVAKATEPKPTSVDADEVARFSAIAAEWWDPKGKFRPLHQLNPVRLAFIRDHVCARLGRDPREATSFAGLRLLDVGCGGGLLCEPMDYRATTAEDLAAAGERFDIVLNMEVIEHVADPAAFMTTCAGLVAPGGLMFVATLNRTLKSFALAIVGAEYVLRWLPRGTHQWNKFITPEELRAMIEAGGLAVKDTSGVIYNPLADEWLASADIDVNYMMMAMRPQDPT
jgi:2-polyprenyl-6-hydroxyphenyl methylase/3-demethylubiquinone-9 3-methyltransferase